LFLFEVFAIDVCAYAVMSNHNHLVLYVDEEKAKSWSTAEVIHRWHQLFKGTLLTHRYQLVYAYTQREHSTKSKL